MVGSRLFCLRSGDAPFAMVHSLVIGRSMIMGQQCIVCRVEGRSSQEDFLMR